MTIYNKSVRWAAVMACTATLGLAAMSGCSDKKPPMTAADKQKAMMDAPGDIIETATGPNMGDVSTVVELIKIAGLVDTLKGPGPFTVFAPTNAAFDNLPPGTVDSLKKPENQEKLKEILLYHVHVGDGILAAEAKTMSLSTADNHPLKIVVVGNDVMVNDAKVVKPDIICKNGVIHWINTVLMPPAPMPTTMPGM
jgi:uncharacterized surface protein with fasciclin (FAS1) repeats